MCVHAEESNAGGIDASNDEICTDMALVAEQMLLQHRHTGDNARRATSGESMKLKIRGDECCSEFGICSGTSTSAPDLRSNEVKLFAVLYKSISMMKSMRRKEGG